MTMRNNPDRSQARDVMTRYVDEATGRAMVTLRGRASLREWASLVRRLVDIDSSELHLDRIIDAREFEGEWSTTEIREIATDFGYAVGHVTGRIAVVADTDATRSMWNMFVTLTGDSGRRVRVFRTADDAARWLTESGGRADP